MCTAMFIFCRSEVQSRARGSGNGSYWRLTWGECENIARGTCTNTHIIIIIGLYSIILYILYNFFLPFAYFVLLLFLKYFIRSYRCAKNVAGKNTTELRAVTPRGRCRRTSIGTCGGNRLDSRCHTINSRKYGRYVRGVYKICVCVCVREFL